MTDQNPTQPFEAPQPESGVPPQPATETAQPTPPPAAPAPALSEAAPVAPPPAADAPAPAPVWSQPAQPAPPAAPSPYAPPLPAEPQMTAPYAPPAPSPYAPPAPPAAQPPYAAQPPQPAQPPYAAPAAAAAAPWVAASQPPIAPAPAWAPPPTDQYGAPVPPTGFDVPIAPVASKPRGRNPIRWVAALLVVALVVVAGLGATLLLTSSTSGTSAVVGYVPADSILYAEGRLDLPGNQRAEVAKTLAAFPGFADQAALNTKMGEVFDKILKAATNDKHDYQTEIAPWFGGQIAIAEGPQGDFSSIQPDQSPAPSPTISPTASLPACTGLPVATPTPSPSDGMGNYSYPVGMMNIRALVLANVTDSKKAGAWVDSILTDAKTTAAVATCDGVTVHVISTPSSGFLDTPDMGWAILGDKVLVAGDLDSIRLAIATKGSGGLSATANFQKAVGALKGDHIGLVYEALRATYEAQLGALKSADTDGTATAAMNVVLTMLPEWIALDLKAADGNFVSTTVEAAPDFTPTTNRASDLAAVAPPKTIALFDSHDVGKVLGAIKAKFAAEPKLATYVKQLDDALGLAGGFDSTIGWIGDAGFAITRDGNSISGGLMVRPEDAAAAKHLFTQLRSLAALSGASSGVSIKDDDYNGVTITTVDLSSLAPLVNSGMDNTFGGMTIPSDLKLVYAVTDKVVLMTLDTNFAKAVIDASQGGDSLAKDARYAALLSKAGDKGTSFVWVDLAAARELIENQLPADMRSKYDSDIRPYLLPLDALISTGVYDNGLNRGTTILSIKH